MNKQVQVMYRAVPTLKGALLMAILAATTVGLLLPWLIVFQPWMHVGMSLSAMAWLGYATVVERIACDNQNKLETYRAMFKNAKVIDNQAELVDLLKELDGTFPVDDCLKEELNGKQDTDTDQ